MAVTLQPQYSGPKAARFRERVNALPDSSRAWVKRFVALLEDVELKALGCLAVAEDEAERAAAAQGVLELHEEAKP